MNSDYFSLPWFMVDDLLSVAAVLPADCGDGRPSDTEELLRPDFDPPPTTPPPPPLKEDPTPPPETPPVQQPPTAKRELNFEVISTRLLDYSYSSHVQFIATRTERL